MEKQFKAGQIVWAITIPNNVCEREVLGGVFLTASDGFAICSPAVNGVTNPKTLLSYHARKTAEHDDKLMEFPIRMNHCDKENANKQFLCGVESVMEFAENIPAADVAPVAHGRWEHNKGGFPLCSNCRTYRMGLYLVNYLNYCPHCGAKMDLETVT